jgi:hypothetical protein
MNNNIEQMELTYCKEFVPDKNCEKNTERICKLNKSIVVKCGTIADKFIYNREQVAYNDTFNVSEKDLGIFAIKEEKGKDEHYNKIYELKELQEIMIDEYEKAIKEINTYEELRGEETGLRIYVDREIPSEMTEQTIKDMKTDHIKRIDENIKHQLDEIQKKTDEEEASKKQAEEDLKNEKKGIYKYSYLTIENNKSVTNLESNSYRASKILNITFDKPLKVTDKDLYIQENKTSLTYLRINELHSLADKHKLSYKLETKDGKKIKVNYDDKGHIKINNEACPRNIQEKIVEELMHTTIPDLKEKIRLISTLGVRKQLLCGMTIINFGSDINNKNINLPINITPVDEEYCNVDFAMKIVKVEWQILIDELISGNKIYN